MTTIQCPTCKSEYHSQLEKCEKCGYPFSADEKTKSEFVARQLLKKGSIGDTKDRLKMSRNILFLIAALNIVFPAFRILSSGQIDIIATFNIVIGLIFLLFGFLIKKAPLASVVIPLAILLILYVAQAASDINTLLSGITWKVIFIVSLVYSIISIRKSDKIKKESEFLASQDYT